MTAEALGAVKGREKAHHSKLPPENIGFQHRLTNIEAQPRRSAGIQFLGLISPCLESLFFVRFSVCLTVCYNVGLETCFLPHFSWIAKVRVGGKETESFYLLKITTTIAASSHALQIYVLGDQR
ncbi:hypothetical protein RND71_014534 [Anisodus tanguticus]|uniref:Uncharacterized protein n=1 Tax=Anisodus tanguticus TaxID=243964 RepID=A0AAE1VMU5_9SOLA|nr:hypothetical protein RND71_014534 [Anisodus tanguticus]